MATKKSTQNAASKTATLAAPAKLEPKSTAFAAMRREAIEHQQAERWEQAAQCWARAGELARSPISKREAEVRAAAARARMEAQVEQAREPIAPAAPQMPQDAPGETPAVGDGPIAMPAPTAQTGAPTADAPAAAATAEETPATGTTAEKTPRPRDERLPPAGSILRRTDRHGNVRCECTIEEAGFRYAGTLYKTLSAAAIAAAKDLGLTSETQNGFTFWGVNKPARRARPVTPSRGSSAPGNATATMPRRLPKPRTKPGCKSTKCCMAISTPSSRSPAPQPRRAPASACGAEQPSGRDRPADFADFADFVLHPTPSRA